MDQTKYWLTRCRTLWVGILVALAGQFYLTGWAEGFRISSAAVLYPILLVTLMRDRHRPDTGLVTGLCVLLLRTVQDLTGGVGLTAALILELPGAIFYLCYDALLCLLLRDRRTVSIRRQGFLFFLCDFLSNAANLALSSRLASFREPLALSTLAWLALARALAAALCLWIIHSFRQLLLQEEHEQRYRRLFLMTADLKTELYFLKKDTEDVETVMNHAYQLYEKLADAPVSEELRSLALSIARDVHEVKKDNLRIIRGLEEEVAEAYDHETMALSDLLNILVVTTRQFLGERRADIYLECSYQRDLPVREHYRLLSILKNLVTNAAEAILADNRRGLIRVDIRCEGERLLLSVWDNGPGIRPRAMKLLFQVGYSTKFNPNTGDISRGVGLPAVQFLVQELGGDIQVRSEPGQGAEFCITLPLDRVTKGGEDHEVLHH